MDRKACHQAEELLRWTFTLVMISRSKTREGFGTSSEPLMVPKGTLAAARTLPWVCGVVEMALQRQFTGVGGSKKLE